MSKILFYRLQNVCGISMCILAVFFIMTFSLLRSLQTSDNSLVNAVLSSDLFFFKSPVFKSWRSSLF